MQEGCRGAGRDALSVLVTLLMFQLLMSWLKDVASLNIPAHAHTRRKHGDAEAEGGCEEGCRGAGRDALLVSVTLLMSQLLMSGLQPVLSTLLASS